MRKIVISVFVAILLASSVQAGHTEWYQQTDCYERLRPNVEPCQRQYDELRAEHQKAPKPVYQEPEIPNEEPPEPVYEEPETLEEEPPQEDEVQPEEPAEKPVAAVANLEGEVWVVTKDGFRTRVSADTVVHSGDTIESKEGRAMFRLQDGHKIIVGRNSQFMFEEPSAIKLSLGHIKAFFSLNKRFTVSTPIAHIGIRGTEFILSHDQTTGTSTMHLHEGEVEVTAGGETEIVQAGNSVVVDGGITSAALSAEQWEAFAQEFEAEEKASNMIWIILVLLTVSVFFIWKLMKKRKRQTAS